MKTAIVNTEIWKDEKIISLNIDTRLLFVCLVTNPERSTTPAFKCGDRLLSAYTGYTKEALTICKKQLQKSGLIYFIDDYIIIGNDAYVKPTRGKLTEELYQKEFAKLPSKIREFIQESLMSHSCVPQEYIDIDINNSIINKKLDNTNTNLEYDISNKNIKLERDPTTTQNNSGVKKGKEKGTKESFDLFYEAYPKKELKKKSMEIWINKNLDGFLPKILDFLEKAKKTERWKKGFIKQPTAFLNGECWEDELASYGGMIDNGIGAKGPVAPIGKYDNIGIKI